MGKKLTVELFFWGFRSRGEAKRSGRLTFFLHKTRPSCSEPPIDQEHKLGDRVHQVHRVRLNNVKIISFNTLLKF